MDAYVYLRVQPGRVPAVLTALSTRPGVRQAAVVVGDWDLLARVDGPELSTIAAGVLSEIHRLDGVTRTLTAPVVPSDRIGIGGFGGPTPPTIMPNACYVHIKAAAGAAGPIAERLAEAPEVSGVAVLGGYYDLIVGVAEVWEVATSTIIETIHALPGVVSTNTLVAVAYDEPEEERDQFSAWS
jgi:DNA-binding Lrp family transcriptional regulator